MRLLERDGPLQALDRLREEAAAGSGRLVFVEGEAGIGKTTLARTFLRSLPARTRAAIGSCDPMATPRPFGPFLELSSNLDPALTTLIDDGDGPAPFFGAFLTLLRREPGTVIVIDDLQWADQPTLDLVRYMGRRIESTGALVIGTYRDDEVDAAHPLRVVLGDLATTTAVRRIPLQPLSEPAVAELADGTDLDPIALHDRTRGNPFFVTEVIAGSPAHIPPTVREG